MALCLTVVRGVLSSAPEVRVLPSGSRLAVLQVTVRPAEGRARSVPVSAWDPPGWIEALGTGDEIVAVGRVERRFFRGDAGQPRSRVEIVAETVVRGGHTKKVAAALAKAQSILERELSSW
jgi:single-stranded DNA-binding protein